MITVSRLPGGNIPREKQIKTLERLGKSEVKYLLANQGSHHPGFERNVAEEWLRQKEDERTTFSSARRDAREEETLSIARKASTDARSARIAAIIAAAIAAIATIIAAYIAAPLTK